MQAYFEISMRLLDPAVRSTLFPMDRPVYTRVQDEVPVKYGLSAAVSNSLVADGCIIEGRVENCIVFRGARIGHGAVVKIPSSCRAVTLAMVPTWITASVIRACWWPIIVVWQVMPAIRFTFRGIPESEPRLF